MSAATVESDDAVIPVATTSDKRRRNVETRTTLTDLSTSSLQLCASFIEFREQRVLVGTCIRVAAAIDHRHSIAYAPRVEYPYGRRSTGCDVILAAIVRNRTPSLEFLGPADECLWGAHWAHLCTSMTQRRHLSLALRVVTQTQFDAVVHLRQLESLALRFNERSPSLGVLLDGTSLPALGRLALKWTSPENSVSLHLVLLSRPYASPHTDRVALGSSSSSSSSESSPTLHATGRFVTTIATRARPSWMCAPGPQVANSLWRTKRWWYAHDRDDRRSAIAGTVDALREIDRLCPLLWLRDTRFRMRPPLFMRFRVRPPLFMRWEVPMLWTANPLPPFLPRGR